jgi:hypothetical protein
MYATPMPSRGDVVVGRDRAGRVLRVSAHPESGRVVLSMWQGSTCIGTFRLAPGDVPDLVRVLTAAAVDAGFGEPPAAAS